MPACSPAEIHRLFEHAFNLGDVEALVALYEPNAVLVVAGQDVIGRESIRRRSRNFFRGVV
jgi:ketosteroid isomerase-like protein